MSLDFQQVQQQVRRLVESAPSRYEEIRKKKETADNLLQSGALEADLLREMVQKAVRLDDPALRCAVPPSPDIRRFELVNSSQALPPAPGAYTALAADGSQIVPDRHLEISYGLVNVGAIQMQYGSSEAPSVSIESKLYYDEQLYSAQGGR